METTEQLFLALAWIAAIGFCLATGRPVFSTPTSWCINGATARKGARLAQNLKLATAVDRDLRAAWQEGGGRQ